MKVLACFTLILLAAANAFGSGESGILGTWKTDKDESKVEIYRCKAKICGKIIWLMRPVYTDKNEGAPGTPVLDRYNPNPELRGRPLIGLQVLDGFSDAGDQTWGNGTCYDPKSGKTYRGKFHVAAPGRLYLRGYLGIPLLGRSSVWTR